MRWLRSPLPIMALRVPVMGGVLLGLFGFVERGAEQGPGAFLVLGLGFVLGHFELQAAGLVEEAPAGFDFVDVLPAGPAAAAAGFFDVFGVDVDFDIGQFGQDGDGGGAGVDAALGFGFGDALHAMAAAFEAEMAVGAVAFDVDDDFLESAAIADGEIVDVEPPAAWLRSICDTSRRDRGRRARLLRRRCRRGFRGRTNRRRCPRRRRIHLSGLRASASALASASGSSRRGQLGHLGIGFVRRHRLQIPHRTSSAGEIIADSG